MNSRISRPACFSVAIVSMLFSLGQAAASLKASHTLAIQRRFVPNQSSLACASALGSTSDTNSRPSIGAALHGETLQPDHRSLTNINYRVIAADAQDVDEESGTDEDEPHVKLTPNAIDSSAGDLECYRIDTPNAIYYLDKSGAGLSSMLDREGNDWLGFSPERGSGAAGEYRGFPNAVFKEAGSYFHATNSGTDPCVTKIVKATSLEVIISAESSNGLWAGQYRFTPDACVFTMTRKPQGHNYWVLYEGVPGGSYEDSDWWMTADSPNRNPMTTNQDGDLAGREWIAFGDQDLSRMLVVSHLNDDSYPDRFYQMQKKMTVFGFGRNGMQKFLGTVPQSFAIGFVESTTHEAAEEFFTNQTQGLSLAAADQQTAKSTRSTASYEQFALKTSGDSKAGEQLFNATKTRCATCHRVKGQGGAVGPDLSSVGSKLGRPHLIDSLLYPSRQIGYGYEAYSVLTLDGQVFTGVIKSQSESEVQLLTAENRSLRIARDDIDQLVASKTSIMPTGLVDSLTPQEFADLVAYLESLGSGKGKFGSGIKGPIRLAQGFEMTTIATGISGATAFEATKDGRLLICEQGGTLRVVKDGRLLPEPMLTIPVEMNWERGLIGVTVAPNFPDDPYIYVVYVTDKPYSHHRVSRFRVSGDVADPASEKILLRGDDQAKFGGKVPAGHQGGAIHFGPDGKLYVGLGEQTAGTPSQQMDALQGKILRINADGSIPDDNPYLESTSGKYQAIWAIGCRNPFTFAFSQSGEMLINDVGGKYEEINPGVAGANYGWPGVDHGPSERADITSPIHIYPQASINGGDFCDSVSGWPREYVGKYFFADFVHGWIKYIDPTNGSQSNEFVSGVRRPVDLRFAPDGSLYVLLRDAWVVDDKFEGGTGALVRIRRANNQAATR